MHYIQRETKITNYMPFPRFLLAIPLSATAKLIYMLLLDRAKMSCTHDGWADEEGHIYVNFTIENLAAALGKKESSIKSGLKDLSDASLIVRKHQGPGKPNRIYVLLPSEEKTATKLPEKRPKDSRKSDCQAGGNPPGNKSMDRDRSSNLTELWGTYHNVCLSESDRAELNTSVPGWETYAEKLSCYMASTGKYYNNHAATIRLWASKDRGMGDPIYKQEGAL